MEKITVIFFNVSKIYNKTTQLTENGFKDNSIISLEKYLPHYLKCIINQIDITFF